MATRIVGLDIGSEELRAVEVENPGDAKARITRVHSIPLAEGAVASGQVVDRDLFVSSLRKLWSTGKFGTKRVALGIGNYRVLAREIELPEMTRQQVRESLAFHVQDKLPMPVDEAVLDFAQSGRYDAESGPMMTGLLVAANKAFVLENVQAVSRAGLSPVEVDLIPFALLRTALQSATAAGVVAVVDVGADTTSILVAKDGRPRFVRLVPTGGREVSRAIAARLSQPESVGERMKHEIGLYATGAGNPDAVTAIEAARTVSGELLTSIRSTLSYYDGAHPKARITSVLLSGGGSQLDGFAQALTEVSGLPVSPLLSGESMSTARGSQPAEPRHAVALGLALGSGR